jgi:CheY-like chemotaxis protein
MSLTAGRASFVQTSPVFHQRNSAVNSMDRPGSFHTGSNSFSMKTILLVDDDQPLRAVLSLALRRSGYCVIEADSGVAGLEMARRHLPDLILTDIDMPGGDGASLLREVRRDAELKSRPVVLMTGTADLLTPRKGMEEEADASLVKPVSLQQLLNCVKSSLNGGAVSQQTEGRWAA